MQVKFINMMNKTIDVHAGQHPLQLEPYSVGSLEDDETAQRWRKAGLDH